MRFEKRLKTLELRLFTDPVILYLPNGGEQRITGKGDFILRLMRGAFENDLSPIQAQQLKWIRESKDALEPDGGHMIELLRSLLNSPTE
jgi:hypothetical protein